jgi:SAM-dependent methyltransferase
VKDAKQRFSNRVEDYVRYRPDYPAEVVSFLEASCGLAYGSVVADVGSGTGILSRLFLENGYRVFAVEPNDGMRAAVERLMSDYYGFESVAGSAEATTLADGSVDLVVVGNALHWIEAGAARTEFSRIFKPDGRVAVVWSSPRRSGTPFLVAFERALSRFRTGWTEGGIEDLYRRTEDFLGGPGGYELACFANAQLLDLAGLEGLVLSYSNVPARGEPNSETMLRDLAGAFRVNQSGGTVSIEYAVRVYCVRRKVLSVVLSHTLIMRIRREVS